MPLTTALTMAACGTNWNADAPAAATTAATPTAADEAAVRRLLGQINRAWERGDATAYASHHTPDADLIDFRASTPSAGKQSSTFSSQRSTGY